MNNAPPPNNPHCCFSGSLACSGCNPCERCLMYVQQYVLPVAMVQAGFNQNPQQANAFFQGYAMGWMRFHQALMQNPQLSRELKITDLSNAYRQEGPVPQQIAQVANCQFCGTYGQLNQNGICLSGCQPVHPNYPPGMQPFPNVQQSPPFPNNEMMGQQVPQNLPTNPYQGQFQPVNSPTINSQSSVARSEVAEKRESEDKQRIQNMVTPKEEPIQADEIVSAASPVPNGNGNPAVLGSVMGPNFVPKTQRDSKDDKPENS